MKKLLILFNALCISLVALNGCGNNSNTSGSTQTSSGPKMQTNVVNSSMDKNESVLHKDFEAVYTITDVNTLPEAVQLNYTQFQSELTAEHDINFYVYIVDSSDAPVANLLLYSPIAWTASKESNHIYGSRQTSTATGLAKFSVPAQDLDCTLTLVLVCSDGFSIVAEKYVEIDLRKLYQQNGSPVIKAVWDEITPNEAAAKSEIVTAKFELPNGEPAANYEVYFELGFIFEVPVDEIFTMEEAIKTVEISGNGTKKIFRAAERSFSRYTDEQGKVTFGSSDIETGKFGYAFFAVFWNGGKYSTYIPTPSLTAIQTITLKDDE